MSTNSPKILRITKRDFLQLNCLHSHQYWVKVLAFRFQQHLGPFSMSLIEGFSETRFFFRTSAMRVFSFSKSSKFDLNSKNPKEKSGKVFLFLLSHLIALKLSKLRTAFLSAAVIVLTNSPKILHITKTDFFQLKSLHSHE